MKTKSKELQAGCTILLRYFWKMVSKNRRRLEGRKEERDTHKHAHKRKSRKGFKPVKKATCILCISENDGGKYV